MTEGLYTNPDRLAWRCATSKACADCAVAKFLNDSDATYEDRNDAASTNFARKNYEYAATIPGVDPVHINNAVHKLAEMRLAEPELHAAIDESSKLDCDQKHDGTIS